MILTYAAMAARLTGRNKDSRKLGNNTYLQRRDGDALAIRLHNTDVVTYFTDGRIQFHDGGYRTVTTKDRINKWAPVVISQKNGHWSITADISYSVAWSDRKWVNYADGMILDTKTGEFEGATGKTEEEITALARRLNQFSSAYMKAFDQGKIPAPDHGDCWSCLLKTPEGKSGMGNHHILEHLKENYFVPSLLANAIQRYPSSQAAREYIAIKWDKNFSGPNFSGAGFVREQVRKSLYRYLKAEMEIAA